MKMTATLILMAILATVASAASFKTVPAGYKVLMVPTNVDMNASGILGVLGGGSGTTLGTETQTWWTVTNKLDAAATNGWEVGSHSVFLTGTATNGFVKASDVTNSLDLSIAPSLTGTVSKAASALQAEADTINSVLLRGSLITNPIANCLKLGALADMLGSRPIAFANPTNFPGPDNIGSYTYLFTEGGVLSRFNSWGDDEAGAGGSYAIYDAGNFLAGTHYLAPNGSSSGMSGCPGGAVATNDTRVTLALTNAGAFAPASYTNVVLAPMALNCSPTVSVSKADIQASRGEMSLALTGVVQLFTLATNTFTAGDAAVWAIYFSDTNSITWDTNLYSGTAWTNATATGSDRVFRKASGKGSAEVR